MSTLFYHDERLNIY